MEADLLSRVERVAQELKIPSNTFLTWKQRGYVPPTRHKEIHEKAKEIGIPMTREELDQSLKPKTNNH